MEKSSNINIRIDNSLKKEAEALFKRLGLNMSTAINIFLSQSIKTGSIPFEIKEKKPNRRTRKALKEAEKIVKNPDKYKSYKNMKEVYEDLGL